MASDVVILGGVRTAFGKFCGALKDHTATDLGVIAAQAALQRSGVAPAEIGHVIFGNVIQSSRDAAYLARHVGLRCGVPIETPAVTVNRLCGSGFEAVVQGAHRLLLGEADFVLAGGAENMTQTPFVVRGARTGIGLGQGKLEDALWDGLNDYYPNLPMAITAENLAQRYGITREEVDTFAYTSQQRAAAAIKAGFLKEEIVPVEVKSRSGPVSFEVDEHPRPETALAGLAKLAPVFKKDGVITAGTASGINDGGGAMVLTTAKIAAERGLSPLGRLVSWGVAGCDPTIMGIGPAPASKQALGRAGMRLGEMDLIEVNEAFSPQYLAVEKELGLNRQITNVNGGAIALGHPLAATGARLTLTILYELRRRQKRFGLATACIGGGQGIALVLEAL
ncbi:MAG: acetyl-CoA C-acetyltransferase [Candidatus Tectomicrobia bacterium]|nr:acetyl-CoA C-acetyltransferase [Candidatus Tectomicrobia bacterium]